MPLPVAFLDGLGGFEVMALAILALMLFGSKRLPELARGFGRAMREFKRATAGVEENLREALRDDPLPVVRTPPRQVPARSSAIEHPRPSETKPASDNGTSTATADSNCNSSLSDAATAVSPAAENASESRDPASPTQDA